MSQTTRHSDESPRRRIHSRGLQKCDGFTKSEFAGAVNITSKILGIPPQHVSINVIFPMILLPAASSTGSYPVGTPWTVNSRFLWATERSLDATYALAYFPRRQNLRRTERTAIVAS